MPSRTQLPLGVIVCLPLLAACGQPVTPTSPSEVHLAAKGTDRPFVGSCTVMIAPRIHDEDEGGGCNGGDHDEGEGGGPPIGRHFDIAGSCQLTHLGRTEVSGRLNITGPFGAGHEPGGGHGSLAVRGRLLFTAANGDQLAGRYVPVAATFTPAGDGGALTFSATEQVGEACSGHEGEVTTVTGHEEPVSTGRFAIAAGTVRLIGAIEIRASTGRGTGTVSLADGFLSY